MTDIDATPATSRTPVGGLVRTARPRQWVKNVLVAAGPLAAGTITEPDTAFDLGVAFVVFCLMSSAVYLLNDVLDREADRAHPVKRFRPVASGVVPVPLALAAAAVLAVGVLLSTVLTGYEQLAIVLAVYAALQLGYCVWLKHEPVLDLALVSSGFLLRVVAGGVATGVVLSPWALLVAGFGSLFMVAGKRYSEVHLVGEGRAATRRSLEVYSQSYLRFVWSISAAATVIFYCLWAFSLDAGPDLLTQLSVVPFFLALLRYAVDIDRGAAGEPESIVLGDRVLQGLGVLWLVLFAVSTIGR